MPISQSNAQDNVGSVIVVGEGAAGVNSGGVVTVQGTIGGIQLPVTDVINVSSQYRVQSVTTTAAQALGGATILAARKLINVTPTNGTIYWGTNSSVTTANGAPIFANQTLSLSFTNNVQVWVIAASTVDCRMLEAS